MLSSPPFFAEFSMICLALRQPYLNVAVTINEKEMAVNEQNQGFDGYFRHFFAEFWFKCPEH